MDHGTVPDLPPPYEEVDSGNSFFTPTKIASRIEQINLRLKEIGYDDIDRAVPCPNYLRGFEESMRYRGACIDSNTYKRKMDKFVGEFERTRDVLTSKIEELQGIGMDDISDYRWKEEHGDMYTIKNYYAAYQSSVDTLTDFIENSTPVDGLKLFVEKNCLVEEKLDLLLRLRRLQISLI